MPFVCFRSTASESSGLYLLSNFAPTPFTLTWPVTLGEKDPAFPRFLLGRTCAYETSEHAYQATTAADLESAQQFEVGGRVTMTAFRTWPVGATYQDLYAQKLKHWGAKAPGIVAKMVTTLKPGLSERAFGIRLLRRPGRNLKCWGPILKAKFDQNQAARRRLRATAPATLVEQARFPRASNYWDASVVGDALVGHNVMGRLVQRVRDLFFLQ